MGQAPMMALFLPTLLTAFDSLIYCTRLQRNPSSMRMPEEQARGCRFKGMKARLQIGIYPGARIDIGKVGR